MNLFGLEDDDLSFEADGVVQKKRSKQPYKEATVRPPTMREARANLGSNGLFSLSDDDLDRPPLDELYPTQAEVIAGVGSNGLTSISSFTGCGGSMTGFAMAGWDDKAAIEFVESARDTLSSNYKSYVLDPVFVMEVAREVAGEMNLDFKVRSVKDEKVQVEDETEVTFNDEESDAGTETVVEAPVDLHASRAVFYWKPKKVKGKKVDIGLDWESTLLSLGGDLSREFRKEVSRRAFERCEKEEGIAIWGDDIRGLDGAELIKHLGIERGDLDCYEGSPPCFPAGTMVLCQDRIRPIEEVEVGHVVLTHKGNWKRVTNTMTRQSDTLILDGGRIEATPDHPFYARRYSNPGNQKNTLESPEWIHAENMEGMFYSVPTAAPSSELPKMPELSQDVDPVAFWRFVGRWLGDGWLRHNVAYDKPNGMVRKRRSGGWSPEPRECLNGCGETSKEMLRKHKVYYAHFCSKKCQNAYNSAERADLGYQGSRGEVFLCSSFDEHDDLWETLTEDIPWGWGAWIQNSIWKYRIANLDLARWLYKHFSKGAANKTIPGWVLGMPQEHREALLRGYLEADGTKNLGEGKEKATTVSRSLAVGIRLLASTLGYSTSWMVDIFKVGDGVGRGYADGREVNVRKQYAVSMNKISDGGDSRYTVLGEDGLRWQKMRGATIDGGQDVTVYDITVEDDHSFVADGYVVHNCKSFSMSGLRESGWGQVLHYSDERNQRTDDLFLEALRVLDDMRPRSFVFENVAGLTMGSAAEDVLKPMMAALAEMGYNAEAREMNASSFDVPQSRPRVIIQGIRNDHYDRDTGLPLYPVWPEISANTYTVRDALDAVERTGANTEEYLQKASLEKYETGKIWRQLPIGSAPENKAYQMVRCHPDMPSPTITATSAGNQPAAGPTHPFECRKFTIPEYRFLFSFPQDYTFTGNVDQQGERMGRSVPPFMMKAIAESLSNTLKNAEIRS